MSILNHFNNLTLTKGQQEAVKAIESFLQSETHVFILKGYAGTGKTTLLQGIGNYLKSINRFAHVMAPTGRAAKVIREKTKLPATTVHKTIYKYDDLKPINTDKDDEHKTFKFFYDIRDNVYNPESIFLIDESSMISNQYSEGEFFRFGTGFLLNDLLSFVKLNKPQCQKVIFVGDPAQLPPVSDSFSAALSKSFFNSLELIVNEIELTEVVRQKEKSGILRNATMLREQLKQTFRNRHTIDLNYPDIKKIRTDEISEFYFKNVASTEMDDRIIVTYSNSRAYQYNQIIRNKLFPTHRDVTAGDILQITYNNYRQEAELLNGEMVKVLWASDRTEKQSAPVMIDNKKKTITLEFRDVELAIPNSDKPLKCKIIDTYLNSKERDLHSNELKALYINFIMRFREKTNSKFSDKSPEFKQAIQTDPYFNAVRAKYGYAITCHKAQGGEWEYAFVDFTGRIGLSSDHLRWAYTAITRAKTRLYVIEPPNITPVTKIKFSPVGKIANIPANAFYYGIPDETPFHNYKTHPAKRLKYFEIEEKLKNTAFHIEKVTTNEYREMYNLSDDEDCKIRIDLVNNAAGLFSTYTSDVNSTDSENLITLIKEPSEWNIEFNYQPKNPVLSLLYHYICSGLDQSSLRITNIEDEYWETKYYVNYYFQTEADCAYIQFYINLKGIISSAIPKSTLGADDKKLIQLIESLNH